MAIFLVNPSGRVVDVAEDRADALLRAGFTRYDAPTEAPSLSREDWTVAELRDYADEHDIDLGSATRKADIIAAIEEAQ